MLVSRGAGRSHCDSAPSRASSAASTPSSSGNYLTTLGRPAEADLELLNDLQMPIKALNATI